MDKSWIPFDRRFVEYIVGVNMFIELALENSDTGDIIRCPCTPSRIVKDHLFFKGFNESHIFGLGKGKTNLT